MLHSIHTHSTIQQHLTPNIRAVHSIGSSFRGCRTSVRPPTLLLPHITGVPATSATNTGKHESRFQVQQQDVTANVGSSTPDELTELAGRVLRHGNGVARQVLSDPDLEGNPLDFLKQTEAFWKALKQQKHEPHKSGSTVITTSSNTIATVLHGNPAINSTTTTSSSSSSSSSHRPPSFGAAPHPAANPAPNSHSSSSSMGVSSSNSSPVETEFDVVVCGGTLGICVALALQQKGFRVAVVEKRRVEGRLQEWNSSRHEIQVLVDMGLLSQAELEAAIVSEFNPIRVGFKGGAEPLTINNVLNIGVCPKTLISTLRARFEVLGGVIYEHTAFKSAVVCADGVVVSLMNAAAAPANVGDTNRPNALQQEQPVQLHSPFGRVAGSEAAAPAAAQHSSGAQGMQHRDNSSSRHDWWVTAINGTKQVSAESSSSTTTNVHGQALPAGSRSSNGSSRSNHVTSRGTAAAGATHGQAAAAAAAAAAAGHMRRAPAKLTCRLVLDCMGHYSPIVKQMRGKVKPDGMVLVVGGCATGYAPEANTSADLLYSITDAAADMQLFWEAFPAEGGRSRTTYMFAYSDADLERPSFEKLLDTYFTLMPAYQGLPSLDTVKYKRVLFGGFPCYSSATPLVPGFDRVLQLGDASASQSPLSFGGFGSLLRHISRLSGAISHALQDDKLSRQDLSWIHPYQPSLSAAWLFQRSMSMPVGQQQEVQMEQKQQKGQQQQHQQLLPGLGSHLGDCAAVGAASTAAATAAGQQSLAAAAASAMSAAAAGVVAAAPSSSLSTNTKGNPTTSTSSKTNSSASAGAAGAPSTAASQPSWLQKLLLLPANHINALLGANFMVMAVLGQRVLKPFLQDTLQLGPLAATMGGMMLVKPLVIARVFLQVGPKVLLGWFGHFAMLALYTAAYHILRPFKHLSNSYTFQRLLDALQFGSSSDYHYAAAPPVKSRASSSMNGGSKEVPPVAVESDMQRKEHAATGVGQDAYAGSRQGKQTVANNIVAGPAVHWGLHEAVVQQQQQQLPNAA